MNSTIQGILQKAVDGGRITPEEGLTLLQEADLLSLGDAANKICAPHGIKPWVTQLKISNKLAARRGDTS